MRVLIATTCLIGLALTLVFVGAGAPAGSPAFTTIDVPDAVSTRAFGINRAGDVVGSYTDSAGKIHGYLLRKGKFTTIDAPDARLTSAWGITPQGEIVGRYGDAEGKVHGFLLSRGRYTTIDFPGGHQYTLPIKINASGTIVGCYHDVNAKPYPDMHGFVRRKGRLTSFPLTGAMHNGISAAGDMAGTVYDPTGRRKGYLVRRGTYVTFDYPGAAETEAWDIAIVGARARPGSPQPRTSTNVVGIYYDTSGSRHGFMLVVASRPRAERPGLFTPINVPRAAHTEVYGISPRGDVVGLYVDSDNKTHGFLLRR